MRTDVWKHQSANKAFRHGRMCVIGHHAPHTNTSQTTVALTYFIVQENEIEKTAACYRGSSKKQRHSFPAAMRYAVLKAAVFTHYTRPKP